jgi:hypothetical protein
VAVLKHTVSTQAELSRGVFFLIVICVIIDKQAAVDQMAVSRFEMDEVDTFAVVCARWDRSFAVPIYN